MRFAHSASFDETEVSRDRFWLWLIVIVFVAVEMRFAIALMSPNVFRPDEIFQNLEPAYRMATGDGLVTWEWRAGLRTQAFPAVLSLLIAPMIKLGFGPAGYIGLITAAMALLSSAVPAIGYLVGWRGGGWIAAVLTAFLCAIWPELILLGPKTLAEVQAGHLMLMGAYLAAYCGPLDRERTTIGPRPASATRFFVAGALLGAAFCVRFQLAPAIALVAIGTARRDWRNRWPAMALGGLIPTLAVGGYEWWTTGVFFRSIWTNLDFNVGQGGAAALFGTRPFWWYGSALVSSMGALSAILAILFAVGFRRAPLFASAALMIVISHSLVPHKEFSFIYAALPFAAIVAGLGLDRIARVAFAKLAPQWSAPGALAFTLAVMAAFALTGIGSLSFQEAASRSGAILKFQALLRDDPNVCGLALRGPEATWIMTGGEAWFGRHVPIYAFISHKAAGEVAGAVNAAIGGRDVADGMDGFTLGQCEETQEGALCLARTARVTCVPNAAYDVQKLDNLGRRETNYGADPAPTAEIER